MLLVTTKVGLLTLIIKLGLGESCSMLVTVLFLVIQEESTMWSNKVSRIDFHQCAASLGSEPLTSGKDVIKPATPGRKWYICGVAMHCAVGGQKLAITVLPSPFTSSPSPTGNTHTRSFGAK